VDTRITWFITAALGLTIISLTTLLCQQFRADIGKAHQRLESYQDTIAQTACGPIQYATSGGGRSVLVIHGIMGGVDQGLVLGEGHLPAGYQPIAPSRFGYLGSPLPENATPVGQADAFACLLDTLGIERAAVMGTSAGATSAIDFALRYPGRCICLILISPNAPGEVDVAPPPRPVASVMYRSDFGFWLMTKYFRSTMTSMLGVPKAFGLTPEFEAAIDEVISTVLPVRPRAEGALFDLFVSNPAVNEFVLEDIAVPVLVIGAADDPLALFRNTKALAERIPNAELVTIADGGHMMLGHGDEVRAAIAAFLAAHCNADT
jgi:pimeloyl-ACP methyl ester carboxylesterase